MQSERLWRLAPTPDGQHFTSRSDIGNDSPNNTDTSTQVGCAGERWPLGCSFPDAVCNTDCRRCTDRHTEARACSNLTTPCPGMSVSAHAMPLQARHVQLPRSLLAAWNARDKWLAHTLTVRLIMVTFSLHSTTWEFQLARAELPLLSQRNCTQPTQWRHSGPPGRWKR